MHKPEGKEDHYVYWIIFGLNFLMKGSSIWLAGRLKLLRRGSLARSIKFIPLSGIMPSAIFAEIMRILDYFELFLVR